MAGEREALRDWHRLFGGVARPESAKGVGRPWSSTADRPRD